MLLSFGAGWAAGVTYIYDELGRLVGVVDQNGSAATYNYDSVGNLLSISSSSSSTVSIVQFTPESGPVGTTVTIYGTGFSTTPSQNSVSFNGTATTVSSATSNALVTTVPSGATTGAITVTTPLGSATSSSSFTVTGGSAGPTITGFTPTSGSAGTTVTITGTNFQTNTAQDRVAFNTTMATVTSASSTSIVAIVPSGATTGPISVATPFGQATSSNNFLIPPPGPALDYTNQSSVGSTVTATSATANDQMLVLFSETAGHSVSISLSNSTFSTCPTATLYDTHGNVLVSQGYCGSGTFIDSQFLPLTGTYSLVINPGNSTGSVNVTIYDSTSSTGAIAVGGAAVVLNLGVGQDGYLTFNGTAGQQVSLKWYNSTLSCPTVSILKPDGSTLASAGSCATSAFIDVQTLPTTGTYQVFIDTGPQAGGITVQLYSSTSTTGAIAIGGAAVTLNLGVGQDAYLTFSGTASQQVSLRWYNSTLSCPTISILKPDNSTLASVGSCASSAFIDVQTLPSTGTYQVFVDTGPQAGSITVQLYDSSAVSGSISVAGPAVTESLGVGQDAYLAFSGTVGQQVSLNWYNSTLSCPTVAILKPDNSTLASVGSCASSAFIDVQTLPSTGTYQVFIDTGSQAGSITVRLNDATQINGSVVVNGASVTETVNPGQDIYLSFSGSQNQQVSFKWSASTLHCPTYKILKPDGSTLTSIGTCNSSGSTGSQTLPTTGTYQGFVDVNDVAGSVTLNVTSP